MHVGRHAFLYLSQKVHSLSLSSKIAGQIVQLILGLAGQVPARWLTPCNGLNFCFSASPKEVSSPAAAGSLGRLEVGGATRPIYL